MTTKERHVVYDLLTRLMHGTCWCGMGIGDPRISQHSDLCKDVCKYISDNAPITDETKRELWKIVQEMEERASTPAEHIFATLARQITMRKTNTHCSCPCHVPGCCGCT